MTSDQLALFVRIAESGSLSRAALSLSLTQPSLSRQLRLLEDELGAALFYRNGRGLILTEAGEALLGRARAILSDLSYAAELISHLGSGVRNAVIGLPPTLSAVLTLPLTTALLSEFPGIRLRLIEGFTTSLVDKLSRGEADVAIMYRPRAADQFSAEPLFYERLCFVTAASKWQAKSEICFETLCRQPLVLPARPHALRVLLEEVANARHLRLDIQFEVDSFSSIVQFVESGIAGSVLPAASVARQIASHQIFALPIADPPVTRHIVLATSRNRPQASGLGKLIAAIKAQVHAVTAHPEGAPLLADAVGGVRAANLALAASSGG
ncbi:LysR family transcriptional regulator [Rhodoligotrophos defluvii]|uniref:LysR family transcriptional regulator n=1 Tax=Rhodoligotrophos defluvii TaxID=2561934 RepID=UPI0010C95FA5|nr:LysR family transcriptional regulator [Rhodoligotrophos defluvii]